MVELSVDPRLSNLRAHILKLLLTLVAQLVKNLAAIQETAGSARDLDSIPWRRKWQPTPLILPWTEEPGRLQSMGLQELDMT